MTTEASSQSTDCLMPGDSFWPRSSLSTVVKLSLPLMVVVAIGVFWAGVKTWYRETWIYLLKRCVLSALAVFYVSYISITKTFVNIFNCIDVYDSLVPFDDHQSKYWASDTSLKCYEESHAALAVIGGLGLVLFSAGFLVGAGIIILKNVQKDDYKQSWIRETMGFMYRAYEPKFVYWESIIMLRKAGVAGIAVFAYPLGTNLQVVFCVLVLVLALFLQTTYNPFRKEFSIVNVMESLSLLVSLLVFLSSLCFSDERVSEGAKITITVVILLCNGALLIYFVAFFVDFALDLIRLSLDRADVEYDRKGGCCHITAVFLSQHTKGTRKCLSCCVNFFNKKHDDLNA